MARSFFQTDAKPFLKWAGGKGQLLDEINKRLPKDEIHSGQIDTYVEPFVGGGAVFFHIVGQFPEIESFYLFDINPDLVACYNAIKNDIEEVINELKALNAIFKRKKGGRKDFFYEIRMQFNTDRDPAKLIFLNKTCFNGLYRVNSSGLFNVPFGDYKNPRICDEENLKVVSKVLAKAEIICGDFGKSERFIEANTFVYLDPPYRPISPTASFTSYTKEDFSLRDQIRLAQFCKNIDARGAKFLLSNSDPKNENPKDHFFEDNYSDFTISRVHAIRAINCKGSKRGMIKELIITNQ
jgi:DNA adenine methylase